MTMKARIIEKTRDIIDNYEGPIVKVPEDVKKDINKVLAEGDEYFSKTGITRG
mgnify:CR=1 FL=1